MQIVKGNGCIFRMHFFQLPIPSPTSLHQCFFSTISSRCPCWLQWHHICLWTDILRKNTYYGGEDSDFHEGWGAGSDVGRPRNLSERRARNPGLPISEVAGSQGWTEGPYSSGSVTESLQPAAVCSFHYSSFLLLIWKSSSNGSPKDCLILSFFH